MNIKMINSGLINLGSSYYYGDQQTSNFVTVFKESDSVTVYVNLTANTEQEINGACDTSFQVGDLFNINNTNIEYLGPNDSTFNLSYFISASTTDSKTVSYFFRKNGIPLISTSCINIFNVPTSTVKCSSNLFLDNGDIIDLVAVCNLNTILTIRRINISINRL